MNWISWVFLGLIFVLLLSSCVRSVLGIFVYRKMKIDTLKKEVLSVEKKDNIS